LRSPLEAKAFLSELRLLLLYLGVSDCNMQEGSLRVDANVNLHVRAESGSGETIATPIVEVKNMNSFRAVERALAYEAQRQFAQWQATGQRLGDVPKQTRGWDDAAEVTRPQRHKEESSDYRYFPDPDLTPVEVSEAELAELRRELGELPAALRLRLQNQYGVSAYDADVIVNQGRALVDYYVALAEACGDGRLASNWVQQDVLRTLGEQKRAIGEFAIPPQRLAELLVLVKHGELDTARARKAFALMLGGKSAAEAVGELGIAPVDEAELLALCRQLVAENPKIVADVRAGQLKAAAGLIGQAKKRNPNVNPARVREICLELIAGG
jgi:aspartyl-tRNA(Asn)/glutamyl-tRNA(Gln) amidotransferase subunit B